MFIYVYVLQYIFIVIYSCMVIVPVLILIISLVILCHSLVRDSKNIHLGHFPQAQILFVVATDFILCVRRCTAVCNQTGFDQYSTSIKMRLMFHRARIIWCNLLLLLLCHERVNGFLLRPSSICDYYDRNDSFASNIHGMQHLQSTTKCFCRNEINDDMNDVRRRNIANLLDCLRNDNKETAASTSTSCSSETTRVHIIGSGISGTLESLPLSTLSLLSNADVVLYDSLSLPLGELKKIVPNHCILESVGKRGGKPSTSMKQADIDQLLLQYATNPLYNTIVRLKGGDPMLFGRTQTEVDILSSIQQQQQTQDQHPTTDDNCSHTNLKYQIIPGLSSCIAGPHYAGIPLTDPKLDCQSFAIYSGTDPFGIGIGNSNDEQRLRRLQYSRNVVDTLVFLMIGNLPKLQKLCETLSNSSMDNDNSTKTWDGNTPCAVVQNAGRINQRDWRGSLSTIVSVIQKDLESLNEKSVSPAIFIVGPTTSLDLRDNH